MVSPDDVKRPEKMNESEQSEQKPDLERDCGRAANPAGQRPQAVLEAAKGHVALSAAPSNMRRQILPDFFSQNDTALSFLFENERSFHE